MLKAIRKNQFINGMGRAFINKGYKISKKFFDKLSAKWWTSGTLDCEYFGTQFKLYNACDDGIPEKLYYANREWHDYDLRLLMLLSPEADVIIDIGANTGVYTALAALSNPKAEIHAFEPYEINAKRLAKNLEVNNVKNVNIQVCAIGDTDGEIELAVPENRSVTQVSSVKQSFSENFGVGKKWEKATVPIKKLDSYAIENNIKVNLIKCDVETYEMSVFDGMREILKDQKPTIIFETFLYPDRLEFFNGILKDYNYHAYFMAKEGLIHCNTELYPPAITDNILFTAVEPTVPFINYNDRELLIKNTMK